MSHIDCSCGFLRFTQTASTVLTCQRNCGNYRVGNSPASVVRGVYSKLCLHIVHINKSYNEDELMNHSPGACTSHSQVVLLRIVLKGVVCHMKRYNSLLYGTKASTQKPSIPRPLRLFKLVKELASGLYRRIKLPSSSYKSMVLTPHALFRCLGLFLVGLGRRTAARHLLLHQAQNRSHLTNTKTSKIPDNSNLDTSLRSIHLRVPVQSDLEKHHSRHGDQEQSHCRHYHHRK
jgi:hypothetical protein